MKELTKAEETIMQVLWEEKKAFVKEIRAKLPDPKPAYNTVSTIVRILEDKGFVSHEAFGKTHQYYPLIDKVDYAKPRSKELVNKYFGGSVARLVSFFAEQENLSLEEMDEILQLIQQKKDKNDE